MNDETTSGLCRLCHRSVGKRQMGRHLNSCWEKHLLPNSSKKARRWFHLVVDGKYARDYWLHVQAPANRTFGELDSLLRAVWLECCGHLSAFSFPAKRPFRRGTPLDYGMLREMLQHGRPSLWEDESSDDRLMGEPLGNKLQPGVVFNHEYDFGTTTNLVLRVAGEHASPAVQGEFKLLARNDPPSIPCSECPKPATQLCAECLPQGEGAFCDACASQHECGEEMQMPLINAPRAGVCGYCGPSSEP
jgi:hypothetical protein